MPDSRSTAVRFNLLSSVLISSALLIGTSCSSDAPTAALAPTGISSVSDSTRAELLTLFYDGDLDTVTAADIGIAFAVSQGVPETDIETYVETILGTDLDPAQIGTDPLSRSDFDGDSIPGGVTDAAILFALVELNLVGADRATAVPQIETFVQTLLNDPAYTITDPAAVPTLMDGVMVPVVSITATDAEASEQDQDPGQFTISRGETIDEELTVTYTVTGTATDPDDFDAEPDLTGTILIPAGETDVTIDITPVDDDLDEPSETIIVTLDDGADYDLGADTEAMVTILDNDGVVLPVVTIEATDPDAAEEAQDPGQFTISLDAAAAADLDVTYTVGGTATDPDDFDPEPDLTGTITIPTGETEVTIDITPVDDDLDEDDETIVVTLADGVDYDLGATADATVTIVDNDDPVAEPVITVVATADQGSEDGDPVTWTFTADVAPVADLAVDITLSGTGITQGDFTTPIPGQITIDAGTTEFVLTRTPADDAEVEGDEQATITVDPGTGYTVGDPAAATVTITDNDAVVLPTVDIVATDDTAAEEAQETGEFTISRDDTVGDLTVLYTVTGTATDPDDFDAEPDLTGTITIPDGSADATILITPVDDAVDDDDETIIIDLDTDAAYQLGASTSATVTITDNDDPVDDTVTLTPPLSGSNLNLQFHVLDPAFATPNFSITAGPTANYTRNTLDPFFPTFTTYVALPPPVVFEEFSEITITDLQEGCVIATVPGDDPRVFELSRSEACNDPAFNTVTLDPPVAGSTASLLFHVLLSPNGAPEPFPAENFTVPGFDPILSQDVDVTYNRQVNGGVFTDSGYTTYQVPAFVEIQDLAEVTVDGLLDGCVVVTDTNIGADPSVPGNRVATSPNCAGF